MTSALQEATVNGLHHITAIAGAPQENFDFYAGVMGMRLVAKSVNQDAPDTWHLFYADGVGTPGTDLTFFPWPDMPGGRSGVGKIAEVSFAIPAGSLDYWQKRFEDKKDVTMGAVEKRFGERVLPFSDPHGLRLALVETEDSPAFVAWEKSPVPEEHQVRGFYAVRMWEGALEPTEALLTRVMGLEKIGEENGWHRYGTGGGAPGTLAEVKVLLDEGTGRLGPGSVHHAAWRVNDDEEELALRETIQRVGLQPTEQIDRHWFRSVYFREPGGVLFELATEGPGFAGHQDSKHLGETLVLPSWLEERREEIEAALLPLDTSRFSSENDQ